jgi:glycosyltransferase involved in cell wall biosynthesis
MGLEKILIIIPTYNEKNNVAYLRICLSNGDYLKSL